MTDYNFKPDAGGTQNVVPTSANQNLTIQKGKNYRLFNGSNTVVFIRMNSSANIVAASATADMPLAVGGVTYTDVDLADTLSIISTGSPTGNFYATPGRGGAR